MRWFISIRYLLSHLRQTLVCVAGVTISVMMFITMTSLMNGFTDKFIIETVESSGHITIHDEPRETRTPILERFYKQPNSVLVVQGVKPRDKIEKIKNPEGLLASLRRMPGILAVAPQVSGDLIITYGTKTLTVHVFGVDPDATTRVSTIGTDVTEGSFSRLKTAADGLIIGRGVSDVLGAKLDDIVTLSSSTGGLTGSPSDVPGMLGYTAAKHGVIGLMRSWANFLAPHNIRVNSVAPTTVRTPMANDGDVSLIIKHVPELANSLTNALPVEAVEAIDVANAVAWLASDEARYVTGTVLPVDAGNVNRR